MREKGFALTPILGLVSIGLIVGILFAASLKNKPTLTKVPFSNKSCQLALEDKFFPPSIGEYKLVKKHEDNGKSHFVVYSNGETPTDSLKISDDIWLRILKEDILNENYNPTPENERINSLIKKALRNQISDNEFGELTESYKKNLILRKEIINGIPVLIYDWQVNVEGPPLHIAFTDNNSNLTVFMGFGKKVENYQSYFENWYKQVCG